MLTSTNPTESGLEGDHFTPSSSSLRTRRWAAGRCKVCCTHTSPPAGEYFSAEHFTDTTKEAASTRDATQAKTDHAWREPGGSSLLRWTGASDPHHTTGAEEPAASDMASHRRHTNSSQDLILIPTLFPLLHVAHVGSESNLAQDSLVSKIEKNRFGRVDQVEPGSRNCLRRGIGHLSPAGVDDVLRLAVLDRDMDRNRFLLARACCSLRSGYLGCCSQQDL